MWDLANPTAFPPSLDSYGPFGDVAAVLCTYGAKWTGKVRKAPEKLILILPGWLYESLLSSFQCSKLQNSWWEKWIPSLLTTGQVWKIPCPLNYIWSQLYQEKGLFRVTKHTRFNSGWESPRQSEALYTLASFFSEFEMMISLSYSYYVCRNEYQ